jgi:hypothetical protein
MQMSDNQQQEAEPMEVLKILKRGEKCRFADQNEQDRFQVLQFKLKNSQFGVDTADVEEFRLLVEEYHALESQDDIYASCRPYPGPDSGVDQHVFKTQLKVKESSIEFSSSEEMNVGGVGIHGVVGTGKTTLSNCLHAPIIRSGTAIVCVVDSKNCGDFDDYQLQFGTVLNLQVGSFPFNPFDGVDPTFVALQAERFAIASGRKDGVALMQFAVKHYFNKRPAGDNSPVTLRKIYNILINEVTPATHRDIFKPDLWKSLLTTIRSVTDSPLGDTFDCEDSEHTIRPDKLLANKMSIVFQTHRLTAGQEEIFVTLWGWSLHEALRLTYTPHSRRLRAVLYLDEGLTHMTERLDQEQRHICGLSELLIKSRAVGLCIMRSSQCPSLESTIASSDTHLNFFGHLTSADDLHMVEKVCPGTADIGRTAAYLPKFEFIVKQASGYADPYIIEVQPLTRQHLTQAAIDAFNKPILDRMGVVISPPLDPAKRALLLHIHRNRFLGTADLIDSFRYKGKQLSTNDGVALLDESVTSLLCERISARLSNRGSATVFYVHTNLGYSVIGNPPDRIKPAAGAGLIPAFCQALIADHFAKAGINAICEADLNGKRVDILVNDPECPNTALELCCTTPFSHEILQAINNLARGASYTITVFIDKAKFQNAEAEFTRILGATPDPRIKICELWHVLNYPLKTIDGFSGLRFDHRKVKQSQSNSTATTIS